MSNAMHSKKISVVQIALWIIGAAGLILGFYFLLTTVSVIKLGGLALWLVAALILHDGLLSPILFGVNFLARKTLVRVSWVSLAIIQVGVIVGGIVALLVLPEIWAKQDGPANNSTLPLDYVLSLSGIWLGIALVVSLILLVLHARHGKNPALTIAESKQAAVVIRPAKKNSAVLAFISKVLSSFAIIVRLLRGFFH